MDVVENFLKKQPIETYVLMVFPAIGIITLLLFGKIHFSYDTLLFYITFGGAFIVYFLLLVYLYYFIKIVFLYVSFFAHKGNRYKENIVTIKQLIKNQIYFTLIIFLPGFFLDTLFDNLARANVSHVIWSTNRIADIDFFIFKKDVFFALGSFASSLGGAWSSVISWILVQSYVNLALILPIFLLVLFLKNKLLARKFILFFFVVQFISTPIYYAMPIIDPLTMYVFNILHINLPSRINMEVDSYKPDPLVLNFQNGVFKSYKQSDNFLALTTFPSLHAAWGFGIVLFAFLLWPWLDLILLPWFILEIIGAVYVGEHYVVDLLLGIVMALIAFFLTNFLYNIEKKYYTGKGSLFIIDTMQDDFKKVTILLPKLLCFWK